MKRRILLINKWDIIRDKVRIFKSLYIIGIEERGVLRIITVEKES
jgi:hypothetical protein